MTVACDEVWGKIGVYEAMEISSRCAEVTIWQEGPAEEGSVLWNRGLQRRRRRRDEGRFVFSSRVWREIRDRVEREGEKQIEGGGGWD
jgi:hypothetical protein